MPKYTVEFTLKHTIEVEAPNGTDAAALVDKSLDAQPLPYNVLSVVQFGLSESHKCPACEAEKERIKGPPAPPQPPGPYGRPSPSGGSPVAMAA